jgi:hypothetical protein
MPSDRYGQYSSDKPTVGTQPPAAYQWTMPERSEPKKVQWKPGSTKVPSTEFAQKVGRPSDEEVASLTGRMGAMARLGGEGISAVMSHVLSRPGSGIAGGSRRPTPIGGQAPPGELGSLAGGSGGTPPAPTPAGIPSPTRIQTGPPESVGSMLTVEGLQRRLQQSPITVASGSPAPSPVGSMAGSSGATSTASSSSGGSGSGFNPQGEEYF